MMVRRMIRAVDGRLGVGPVTRKALTKVFPDHWSFMLGEIALYSFAVLVITGVFLTFFFVPSSAETIYRGDYSPLDGEPVPAAFASVVALSFDVPAGLLVRQTHHWAALIFVGAIIAHLIRIFFTGAFRRPREVNWVVGVTLLALVLLTAFVGYSMSDDLLSGTGLRIVYSVVESVPVVGAWLALLLFGGEFPSELMVPRLFVVHVLLLPAALIALISLHMAILVRQRHTQFAGAGRTEHNVVGSRLWPGYATRTAALFGYVAGTAVTLGGLVQINPVWLYGPYHPAQVTTPAAPDWYLAWGDGILRLFPAVEFRVFGYLVPGLFLSGVVALAAALLGLYAWPFLEARLTGDRGPHHLLDRPRDHPARVGIGVAALTVVGVLTVAGANDVLAYLLEAPVTTVTSILRVAVLTLPWVTGATAYWVARALRDRPASRLGSLSLSDVRASARQASRSEAPAMPRGAPDGARVELWRRVGQGWRWRYVEPRGGESLLSTESFPDRRSATTAATIAYPEVSVEHVPAPAVVPAAPERRGVRDGLAAIAGLAVLLVVRRRHRRGGDRA